MNAVKNIRSLATRYKVAILMIVITLIVTACGTASAPETEIASGTHIISEQYSQSVQYKVYSTGRIELVRYDKVGYLSGGISPCRLWSAHSCAQAWDFQVWTMSESDGTYSVHTTP